jgi:hypothetical protein
MSSFQRIAGNILIALNALLIVFLTFGDRMVFPAWLQAIGRIHPLLLHLPIGAVVIVLITIYLKRDVSWMVAFAAITASLTAIMGIILSAEGGYDETSLAIHKYAGALVSILLAVGFFINS